MSSYLAPLRHTTPQISSGRPLAVQRLAPITWQRSKATRAAAYGGARNFPATTIRGSMSPREGAPSRSPDCVRRRWESSAVCPWPVGAVAAPSCRPRSPRDISCSAAMPDPLVPLGYDFLTFLAATVLVVPLFKRAKVSPVLGFLFAGVVLNQLGLFRSVEEIEKLGELGVLFLLFEQGLELTVDRLQSLSKYAFGMGFLQMALCTATFTAFALPVGGGLGSVILEHVFNAPPSLVGIRSIDEAIVIGYALSLSSSAFVLQVMGERGELPTKYGSATLGILLFQDIAVVPFLVLLPQLEASPGTDSISMRTLLDLWPEALSGVVFLGLLLLSGRVILRRVFENVAEADSPETFVAACLLTVTGTSVVTQSMGFSDTLGAFLAGVLLAETNFRTQVEADVRAIRGILLGLFFVTTGASINLELLFSQLPVVLGLVVGLLGVKSLIMFLIGPLFGLTRAESVRTGLLMSQGGEFAFVLLSLANELDVLPPDLNKLLIIVVVISMALTPWLAELSTVLGDMWEEPRDEPTELVDLEPESASGLREDAVVMCGFGQMGQVLANMLTSPLALGDNPTFVAFELDPACVNAARSLGFPAYYADGTRTDVLELVGVENPRAIVVLYPDHEQAMLTVSNYRSTFPDVPIYAHTSDLWRAAELRRAGATKVVSSTSDTAVSMGKGILKDLCGSSDRDTEYLSGLIVQSLTRRTEELQLAQAKREQDKKSITMSMEDIQAGISETFSKAEVMDLEYGPVTSEDFEQPAASSSLELLRSGGAGYEGEDGGEDEAAGQGAAEDLIDILGGTPKAEMKYSESLEALGIVCGADSSSPEQCIDLSIKPVERQA